MGEQEHTDRVDAVPQKLKQKKGGLRVSDACYSLLGGIGGVYVATACCGVVGRVLALVLVKWWLC